VGGNEKELYFDAENGLIQICIVVMLVKVMMSKQIDYLLVYKPMHLVNIAEMLENIEVMLDLKSNFNKHLFD
jgi:hypothetical protein